ncbi:MAG: hypothetical protein HY080_04905 [Gammaproteobacteria bacterium]|nr:hypothetical protein [Gammaproteobacteria bacterium]
MKLLSVRSVVAEFGILRVLLIGGAVFSLLLRPTPMIDPSYSGWNILFYLLVPVLAPIQFMLHALDALMGLVLMSDKIGSERLRYRRIVMTQSILALVLLAYWGPYFIAINGNLK